MKAHTKEVINITPKNNAIYNTVSTKEKFAKSTVL